MALALSEFGFAQTLADSEAVEAEQSDDSPSARDDGRRTLGRFPKNLGLGFAGVFTKQNRKPFLIGALVTAGGFVFDDTFQTALGNEDDNIADVANDYAGPIGLGLLTTGLFIGGRYSNDPKFRAVTYDMAIAAIVNIAYTGAIKTAINRDRPNDSGSDSFPSGHTSNAFALAAVAGHHYGKKLRFLSYGGATLIGISRLRSDAHWLSDILAGATLGILVGRGVVWMNNRPIKQEGQARRSLSIAPILGRGTYGVNVALRFR